MFWYTHHDAHRPHEDAAYRPVEDVGKDHHRKQAESDDHLRINLIWINITRFRLIIFGLIF